MTAAGVINTNIQNCKPTEEVNLWLRLVKKSWLGRLGKNPDPDYQIGPDVWGVKACFGV